MRIVKINGKDYNAKLRNKAVRDFEKKTGISVFSITEDNISSFTDISDLVYSCVDNLKEDVYDELEFTEVIDLLKQLLSPKKEEAPEA